MLRSWQPVSVVGFGTKRPSLAILAAELGHTEQAVSLCGTAGVPAVDSAPATPGGSQPRDDLVSLQPSAMLPSAS